MLWTPLAAYGCTTLLPVFVLFWCQKSADGEHIKAAILDGCGDDNYQDVTLDPSFQRAHEMCGQDITVISQNDTEVNLTSQQIQTPHAHTPRISRMAVLDDSFDRSVFFFFFFFSSTEQFFLISLTSSNLPLSSSIFSWGRGGGGGHKWSDMGTVLDCMVCWWEDRHNYVAVSVDFSCRMSIVTGL